MSEAIECYTAAFKRAFKNKAWLQRGPIEDFACKETLECDSNFFLYPEDIAAAQAEIDAQYVVSDVMIDSFIRGCYSEDIGFWTTEERLAKPHVRAKVRAGLEAAIAQMLKECEARPRE